MKYYRKVKDLCRVAHTEQSIADQLGISRGRVLRYSRVVLLGQEIPEIERCYLDKEIDDKQISILCNALHNGTLVEEWRSMRK